jgi:hypothetical protein
MPDPAPSLPTTEAADPSTLDFEALAKATVFAAPFHFMIADRLIRPDRLEAVGADFPAITQPGLFPLQALSYGPNFAALIEELRGPRFAAAVGEALGVGLTGRAQMITVRGCCRSNDGAIHADSEDKLVSALLYLNRAWPGEGGRLRLLRNRYDLDDMVAEVAPRAGTFVAFRRSDNSWHGHKPYAGPRRAIMVNWMTEPAAARRETLRHRVSAWAKVLRGWGR